MMMSQELSGGAKYWFLCTVDVTGVAITICLLLMAAAVFWALWFQNVRERDERLPFEEGRSPLLECRCAGLIDGDRLNSPLLRIALYDDGLVFSGPGVHVALPLEEFIRVSRARYFFEMCLEIHHRGAGVSTPIVVTGRATEHLQRILSGNDRTEPNGVKPNGARPAK